MYISPTHGTLSMEVMFDKVKEYIMSEPDYQYIIMIGSDSQKHKSATTFVTAVIVHRVGRGAIYFYERNNHSTPYPSLKLRIWAEASNSLDLAIRLKEEVLSGDKEFPVNVQVHLDIGRTGKTASLIKELVGYIESSGFHACIKPWSIAASSAADKHTR